MADVEVLLDTHVFLWLHAEPERLGPHLTLLEAPATGRLVSAVVGWEIAIKHGLGRIELPAAPSTWVPDRIRLGAMEVLPIELADGLGVHELPLHHRDPFDRLLISQARRLGLPILTADAVFERYDVEVLRA